MYFKYNLITSFTPQTAELFLSENKQKKIFLKELFILWYFIDKIRVSEAILLKSSMFVQPKNHKKFVILRAPYRYKLARLQLLMRNYKITLCLSVYMEGDYVAVDKNIFRKNTFKSSTFSIAMYSIHKMYRTINQANFELKDFNIILVQYNL